jgi:hypothetical protein
MVALVFGQSNAANHGAERGCAPDTVRVFYNGSFYPAHDPLPGASGDEGSVWSRLGRRLIDSGAFEGVTFVPMALGGAAVADFAPEGKLHAQLLGVLESARAAGLVFTHLLWHQGERDTLLETGGESYRTAFLGMLAGIRAAGVDAPVHVSRATYRFGVLNVEVQAAQRDLVNEDAGILAGPDTDALGQAYRRDDVHFSGPGLEAFADLWMETLLAEAKPLAAAIA